MRSVSVPQGSPLPVGSVKLGRLVRDTSQPLRNFQDPPNSRPGGRPPNPVFKALTDLGFRFSEVCAIPEIRTWLERAIKEGSEVHMVTGFNAHDGQIRSIKYRKVQFNWYSSRKVAHAFLQRHNRWEVSGKGIGRDHEKDVVEACLVSGGEDGDEEEEEGEEDDETITEVGKAVPGAMGNFLGRKRVSEAVFRVTGIPLATTVHDLRDIISSEFSSKKISLDTNQITICPSCYDKNTQTALVQFETYPPPILNDLPNNNTHQIRLCSTDISIDKDFYGLTQLYPTKGRIVADVVAVCGLNSHAYGSWAGKRNRWGEQKMWLRHFLSEDLPDCRTMIYGYNSKLESRSAPKIPNFTDMFLGELKEARKSQEEKERPIIFIGHSFGGIIIAQSIFKAKCHAEHEHVGSSLFSSIRAIIFFGTPHRGLVVNDVLAMLEQGSPSKDLVASVRRESMKLRRKLKKFDRFPDLRIVSFEETEQTRKMEKGPNGRWSRSGDFFTDAESAWPMLRLPDNIEETVSAKGDNSTVIKFKHEEHSSYESAIKHLRDFTKSFRQMRCNSISISVDASADPENEPTDFSGIKSQATSHHTTGRPESPHLGTGRPLGLSSGYQLHAPGKLSNSSLYGGLSQSDRSSQLIEAEPVEPNIGIFPLLSRSSSSRLSTNEFGTASYFPEASINLLQPPRINPTLSSLAVDELAQTTTSTSPSVGGKSFMSVPLSSSTLPTFLATALEDLPQLSSSGPNDLLVAPFRDAEFPTKDRVSLSPILRETPDLITSESSSIMAEGGYLEALSMSTSASLPIPVTVQSDIPGLVQHEPPPALGTSSAQTTIDVFKYHRAFALLRKPWFSTNQKLIGTNKIARNRSWSRLRELSDNTMQPVNVKSGTTSAYEQTTMFGVATDKKITEKYSPPHSMVESHDTHDSTIQYTSTVGTDYSWPARFADGKTDINFPIGCRWGLLNEAKGWIEDLVQEPINWWPLSPRRHPLPENCLRVNWKCRCGKRLSGVISRERMSQYNQWLSSHNNGLSSPANHNPTPASSPAQDGAKTRNNPGSGNISPSPTTNLPRGTLNSPIASAAARNQNNVQNRRLMWCVNLGSRLTLVTDLEVYSGDDDASVFRNLRTKYWKIRGWRKWLSLYSISDIKFVKFNRYRLQRVSCYSKEELPIPDNRCYDYQPRPPDEVPPVPAQLLMEYFEDPSCAGTSAETLQKFPKKVDGPLGGQERYGWGLHACEHLSFFRTAILSLLILVGPTYFFVNWLVRHPGDLQNASVPLFLAFAAIGTFIIIPHYFG